MILKDYPEDIVFEEEYEEFEAMEGSNEPFEIEVFDGNYYVVTGVGVEKMMGYTNLETGKGICVLPEIFKRKRYYCRS